MATPNLSPAIRRFIGEHIDSAEQLDILLLLQRDPTKQWTAMDVSQAIYTVPASATMRLEILTSAGFLASTGGSDPGYRFDPASDSLRQQVAELAAAYASDRVGVIKLIFAKPPDPLESFSDAFRFKGKKD